MPRLLAFQFAVFFLFISLTLVSARLVVPDTARAISHPPDGHGNQHPILNTEKEYGNSENTEIPLFMQRKGIYKRHKVVALTVDYGMRNEVKTLLDNLDADVWGVQTVGMVNNGEDEELDGAKTPRRVHHVEITARVTPEQLDLIESAISASTSTPSFNSQFSIRILNSDIQPLIDAESLHLASLGSKKEDPADPSWHSRYHPPASVFKYYEYQAHTHPHLVRLVPSIGKTHEGRDLFAVHLTNRNTSSSSSSSSSKERKKKKVWWQSNIHAREWISGAVTQYLTHLILDGHARGDPEFARLLDEFEIILIPLVNPDGNAYTWSHARLWRKNRNPGSFGAVGVDINRNYDEGWSLNGGASDNPFSEVYQVRDRSLALVVGIWLLTTLFRYFPAGFSFRRME